MRMSNKLRDKQTQLSLHTSLLDFQNLRALLSKEPDIESPMFLGLIWVFLGPEVWKALAQRGLV